MYNFDPYNVFLPISTNIAVLLMTVFVLQGHKCVLAVFVHNHPNDNIIIIIIIISFSDQAVQRFLADKKHNLVTSKVK